MNKTCTQCKNDKPLDAFHKHKGCKFGVSSTCKSCSSLRFKKYYYGNIDHCKKIRRDARTSNKTGFNQTCKESRAKRRVEVLSHYSGGTPRCACCFETRIEFLSLDHIYGGGNKHRKEIGAGSSVYRWAKKNSYPQGLRVLCYNCNLSMGFNGYCPHSQVSAQ